MTNIVAVLLAYWLGDGPALNSELLATFVVFGGIVPAAGRFLARSGGNEQRHTPPHSDLSRTFISSDSPSNSIEAGSSA